MSNPIPKEGALMEKELTVDLDTLSVVPTVVVPSVVVPMVSPSVVVPTVVSPSVVVPTVVSPSVVVPSVVHMVVITGVPHSDPVNPGAHSTPNLTFTFTLSIISLKPVLASIPSGNNVPSGENLLKPSSAPFLVTLINTPILRLADEYSQLRLSAPGPRFSV